MAKSSCFHKLQIKLYFSKNFFLFFILLSLSQIPKLNCADCSGSSKIKSGDNCFNGIIHLKGRFIQFSVRKDGVLIVEYSNGIQPFFLV